MKQKIKYNRKPLIILLCFDAAFAIAAILCFAIPRLNKSKSPVELVDNKIYMAYDLQYHAYCLRGELKNVSDETITIKNKGGMRITFKNSDDVFDDGWSAEIAGTSPNEYYVYHDVTLEAGETYNFKDCVWTLSGDSPITQLKVTIDGKAYYLIGSDNLPNILMLVFILFAFVFLIVAVTQDKNMRNNAIKKNAVLDLCTSTGEKSYLFSVSVTDKSESKKAAAKTAGWVAGAVLTTLFTGVGVYRVYSGTTMTDFVLSEHHLYSVNGSAQQGMSALNPVTRNDYPTASIEIKKKNVIVHHVDGKKSLTFLYNKNCELTVEQIAEYLNNVLVKPIAQPEVNGLSETATAEADPFEEFNIAAANTDATDTKALDESFDDGLDNGEDNEDNN